MQAAELSLGAVPLVVPTSSDLGPDLPAGLADEPIDHRKAEACPFSERLCREERIEGLRDNVRWLNSASKSSPNSSAAVERLTVIGKSSG